MSGVPTLIGTGGAFKGEVFALEHFRPLTVGRSRKTDISVKRTQNYKLQSETERDKDSAAKTISARHFQITYYSLNSIELKNLSVNGTLLDGKPIATVFIEDIAEKAHEISIGQDGRFKLMLCEQKQAGGALPL